MRGKRVRAQMHFERCCHDTQRATTLSCCTPAFLERIFIHVNAFYDARTRVQVQFKIAFNVIRGISAGCQEQIIHDLSTSFSCRRLHQARLRNVELHRLWWTHLGKIVVLIAVVKIVSVLGVRLVLGREELSASRCHWCRCAWRPGRGSN